MTAKLSFESRVICFRIKGTDIKFKMRNASQLMHGTVDEKEYTAFENYVMGLRAKMQDADVEVISEDQYGIN